MRIDSFVVPVYLFPQSGPPFDEGFEISLPKNLQILTVCENVRSCQVEGTPSETGLSDTSSRRNEEWSYSFSSAVSNEILFTLPRKETGSAPRINSAAVPSLNSM